MEMENEPGITDANTAQTDEGSSPRNEVTVQSQFDLPKHFEFDQTYRYVSALPALAVDGYSTADARVSWKWNDSVEMSVVGNNLLQPFHVETTGAPGPLVGVKRGVYAKIVWTR
jgi:hypothetical protein